MKKPPKRGLGLVVIMSFALIDLYLFFRDTVNKAVGVVDSSAP